MSEDVCLSKEQVLQARAKGTTSLASANTGSTGTLRLHVLASGSKGNAAIVENTRTGQGLLIDAGICKRDVLSRAEEAGFPLENLKATLITHEHSDHVKGLGVLYREFAKRNLEVPLYVNEDSKWASKAIRELDGIAEIKGLDEGQQLSLAGLQVAPFATSHDSISSFGFRIWDGLDCLGYMTDTGIVTEAAHEALVGCRILAIEANHDPNMLENGPYPYHLQQRVASDLGHLSNDQSADELRSLLHPGLQQVMAMHISENNNTYRLPVEALRSVIDEEGHGTSVACAYQNRLVSC